MTRFSERHKLAAASPEIRIRDDAPEELRSVVLTIAYEQGLSPTPMRDLLCRVLRRRPDPGNWSEWPNVANECQQLIESCPWYQVYDVIEEIYKALRHSRFHDHRHGPHHVAEMFAEELNRYFLREGIGWQLTEGVIEVRGAEGFEVVVREAQDAVASQNRTTAANELHEAISDLSRRPSADLTGAIQHAMSALECVMRDVCGNNKATLGDLVKKYPDTFPKPLDQAVEKLWGYSSETGRHLKEGAMPSFEEAELIVGTASALCRYLSRKLR